jgi:hypothetical protein
MENTAQAEFNGIELPSFLYEDDNEVKIGMHGDSICTDEFKEWIAKLQAKHEEELKQAVIDAYVDGCDLGTYEQNTKEARQYYEANFNTKEL